MELFMAPPSPLFPPRLVILTLRDEGELDDPNALLALEGDGEDNASAAEAAAIGSGDLQWPSLPPLPSSDDDENEATAMALLLPSIFLTALRAFGLIAAAAADAGAAAPPCSGGGACDVDADEDEPRPPPGTHEGLGGGGGGGGGSSITFGMSLFG